MMGFRFWQALQKLQSVGIEPTLLRTRALSVRLNRSAKTANWRLSGNKPDLSQPQGCRSSDGRLGSWPWRQSPSNSGQPLSTVATAYKLGWCSWLSRVPHTHEVTSSILVPSIFSCFCNRISLCVSLLRAKRQPFSEWGQAKKNALTVDRTRDL